MCKFMLDSNLIKKYSKLGLWSKIVLVVFTLALVVGGIVGYFLHKNDNVYAADGQKFYIQISSYNNLNMGQFDRTPKDVLKSISFYKDSNTTTPSKTVLFKDCSEDAYDNTKIELPDGVKMSDFQGGFTIETKSDLASCTIGQATCDDEKHNFHNPSRNWETNISYFGKDINCTNNITLYVIVSEKRKVTFDEESRKLLKDELVKGNVLVLNTDRGYESQYVYLGDRDSNGNLLSEEEKVKSFDLYLFTNQEYTFQFSKNPGGGEIDSSYFLFDKLIVTEDGGTSSDFLVYNNHAYITVNDAATITVQKTDLVETPVTVGKVNDHDVGKVKLGNFVSDISTKCSCYREDPGSLSGSKPFADLSSYTLDENDESKNVQVSQTKDWHNNLNFTIRKDSNFSISSISILYKDGTTDTVTATKQDDGTYLSSFVANGSGITGIEVNLAGNGYKKLNCITDSGITPGNGTDEQEFVFNCKESTVTFEESAKDYSAYMGYDIVELNGEWTIVNGYAEFVLNDGYMVNGEKVSYRYGNNTDDNKGIKKCGEGRYIVELVGKFGEENPKGILTVDIVSPENLTKIFFITDDEFETVVTDGIESVKIDVKDGNNTINVEADKFENTKDDGSKEGEFSAWVAPKVERDAEDNNKITSAELNATVTLTFKDGYTLQDINEEADILKFNILPYNSEEGLADCESSFSNVNEYLDEDNNTICTFDINIKQYKNQDSDTGQGSDNTPKLTDVLQFGRVDVKLKLVLRDYTVKFVDENNEVYDPNVFSISTRTQSSPTENGNTNESQDSYKTDKNYIKFSASAKKVYFDVILTDNYTDCKSSLEYEYDNTLLEVGRVKEDSNDFYFEMNGNNSDPKQTVFTVTIKNIQPNVLYAPETIEPDSAMKKYGIDVAATLKGPKGEKTIIDGKSYYPYSALNSELTYEITGLNKDKYVKWLENRGKLPSDILSTEFFDTSGAAIIRNADATEATISFVNLRSDVVIPNPSKGGLRVIDTILIGPEESRIDVNFTINSRYTDFFDFVKLVESENKTWSIDSVINWADPEGGQSYQKVVKTSYLYYPLADDILECVALKSKGAEVMDFRDMTRDMTVVPDENNPKECISVDSSMKIPDVFSENEYKIVGMTLNPIKLSENSFVTTYNFRFLNIKYPSCNVEINVPSNMAKFSIVSGFLTDEWKVTDLDDGKSQKLAAVCNYNANIMFNVQPMSGYVISDVRDEIQMFSAIDDNGNGVTPIEYKYTEYQDENDESVLEIGLDDVKTNLYIYVNFGPTHKVITHSKIEGANYYRIEKTQDKKYHCKEMMIGRNTVPVDSSYYFAVEAQTGYDIESLKLSSSDSGELSPMDQQPELLYDSGSKRSSEIRVYELKFVKKNQTISGTISKEKCSINFNLDKNYPEALTYKYEGQLLKSSKKVDVDYGSSIEFSIEIMEKYNRSNYRIMLKDSSGSSRELNLVDGVYNISNITDDKDVFVEGIAINKYNINLVKNDAAEYLDNNQSVIYGVQTVEYNGDYYFQVRANEGYSIGDSTQVMCTSEDGTKKTLSPDNSGKYKLSNVKEDFTINILDIDDIYYNITLEPVEGVTYVNDKDAVVTGSIKIKHGNNFEFGVNVDDAYDDSKAGMYIIINDGQSQNLRAQILYSGRYTINNITEDATIKVGNIRKNSYTVTLNKVEGMDFYDKSNKVINGDNTVLHGESLSFKVNLYPAYYSSKVKIMLGTQELSADDSGFYTVKNVIENKIVTVNGVEETIESKFTNTVNNLPDKVSSLSDVDDVISASKVYESLSDEQKERVGNIDKLRSLQEQVKGYHHISNDVVVEGLDWNIKLFAIPLDNDMSVYTRLYQKLSSEYILSLYNVYLWDTLKDERYTLPEGQNVVVSLPTPEMTYFEKPTGIHEKENGKLDYLSLIYGSDKVSFTTGSFSLMGVVANRSSTPGRSSLLDTWDANVQAIKEYALSNMNSGGSKNENTSTGADNLPDDGYSSEENGDGTGNINEKFKSRNNPVTPRGSAIRLLLVLLILILLSIIIIIIIENMKKIKENKKGKK